MAMFESNGRGFASLPAFLPKARHGNGTAEQRSSAHRDRNRHLIRELAVGDLLVAQAICIVRAR
tara:strand:- start:28 stop:219 length:192 start_codon:yes stop_codon:yes gene_type:complete